LEKTGVSVGVLRSQRVQLKRREKRGTKNQKTPWTKNDPDVLSTKKLGTLAQNKKKKGGKGKEKEWGHCRNMGAVVVKTRGFSAEKKRAIGTKEL